MKPAGFRYERPDTIAGAIALLQDDATEPMALAGGQSLMPMMNFRVARPGVLVDLNRIKGMDGIGETGDQIRIGAMTRYAMLEASMSLATHVPLIARVLPHIAHPAIRTRGTLGGSLALADPAAEMPAVALATKATLHLEGPDGARDVGADDFFLGAYETSLAQGELITAVSFPKAKPGDRFGFHEITRRHGDYAMAGVVVAKSEAGFRVALFGIGDGAMRCPDAEAALTANPGDHDGAIAALQSLDFPGDLNGSSDTKRHLAGVALRRALDEAGL